MLAEMVEVITYTEFVYHFSGFVNYPVNKLLQKKNVFLVKDFYKLDDIEARYILDQIVMYSGLPEVRINCV